GPGAERGARRRAGDALRRTPRPAPPARVAAVGRAAGRVFAPVESRVRSLVREGPSRALAGAIHRPRRVLLIAVVAAAAGWALGSQTNVVSDVQRLVPSNLREIRDVKTLQDTTGVSGDINVLVRARDLTD